MKNSKWISRIVSIVVTLVAIDASAQAAKPLTWREATNLALQENRSLVAAKRSLDADREDVVIARSKLLPSLLGKGQFVFSKSETYSEDMGVIPSTSATLGGMVTQTVFSEKSIAGYAVQKRIYESRVDDLLQTEQQLAARVGQAYLGLLLSENLYLAVTHNLKLTETNLQVAKDRAEAGSTDKREVLRWETALYAAQQQAVEKEAAVLTGRMALNQLLARPLDSKIPVSPVTLEKDGFVFSSAEVTAALGNEAGARKIRSYLTALGIARSPALSSLRKRIEAGQRQHLSNKLWLVPSLDAAAGAEAFLYREGEGSDEMSENKAFWKVGMVLSWPVFSGGAFIAKLKQSGFQNAAMSAEEQELTASMEQQIHAAVTVAYSDYQRMDLAKSQTRMADENYTLVNEAYLEGEVSLQDLIDAQEQVLRAESATAAAAYAFYSDLLNLYRAVGYFPVTAPEADERSLIADLEASLAGD